MKFGVLGTI